MSDVDCMGTKEAAERRLVEAWRAWKVHCQPLIAPPAEHKRNAASRHAAENQLRNEAATLAWHLEHAGCAPPPEAGDPTLEVAHVRGTRVMAALNADAWHILQLVVAEWTSDPVSVQCFDLRIVEKAKALVARRRELLGEP